METKETMADLQIELDEIILDADHPTFFFEAGEHEFAGNVTSMLLIDDEEEEMIKVDTIVGVVCSILEEVREGHSAPVVFKDDLKLYSSLGVRYDEMDNMSVDGLYDQIVDMITYDFSRASITELGFKITYVGKEDGSKKR